MPLVEALIAGRQITDPRQAQAFEEIIDKLELLFQAITVSPRDEFNIGFGGFPREGLLLDLNDPVKKLGIGFPQLTITERNALRNPPRGTIVYNLSLNCLSIFNGLNWIDIGSVLSAYGIVGSSTAGETELLGIDLPPSFLDENGKSFNWEFHGLTAANGNTKQFKIYIYQSGDAGFGTLIWDSTANVFDVTGSPHYFAGEIKRITPTSQYCIAWGQSQNNLAVRSMYSTDLTKTLANTLRLRVTGIAATTNNDCVSRSLTVRKAS